MSLECEKAASHHEKNWRKKKFPNIESVSSQDKRCSACGECVLLAADHCFINRIVGTIHCRPCHDHFEAVEPWKTSTSQSLCIICGYEKFDRYQCVKNDCSYAVCKSCVLRNSAGSMLDIEKQQWICFVCNVTQLYRSRAIAAVLMTKLAEQSKKDQSKMEVAPKKETLKQVLNASDSSEASSEPVVLLSKTQTEKSRNPSVESLTSHETTRTRTTRAQARATARARDLSVSSSSSSNTSDKKTLQRKARTRALDKIRKAHAKQKSSGKRKVPNVKKIQQLHRHNSNSGSEKEFSKYKIIESYVPLKRLRGLDKDYTHPIEDSPPKITENLTQNAGFHLKNIIRTFCRDLKLEAKKLMNEAEKLEKNYNYAPQLTISDSVCAIIDCKTVMDDFITNQTNYKKKLTDNYENWCKKAQVKNIFTCDKVKKDDEPVAGPSKKLTAAEEQEEKRLENNTKTTEVINEINSLDSDSNLHSRIPDSNNEKPKSPLRNTSTPVNNACPIQEDNDHSMSRRSVDMFSDDEETKSAPKTRETSSGESEFEFPPRTRTPSKNDSSDQSVATVILDRNDDLAANDLSEMVQTLSPIAQVNELESSGSVVESSLQKDDETSLPSPKISSPSCVKEVSERKIPSDSSSDTDIERGLRIGSQAAVLTLSSESETGASPPVAVESADKINSPSTLPSQSEETKLRNASPPPPSPASKNNETHKEAVDAEQKKKCTSGSKQTLEPVIACEKLAVEKEVAVNLLESNSGLPLVEKEAGASGAIADKVDQPSETMESVEPISSGAVEPDSTDCDVVLNGVSDEILKLEKAAKARLLSESSDSDTEENVMNNSPSPANCASSPEPGEIINSTEVFRPKLNHNLDSGEKETCKAKSTLKKSRRKNGMDLNALEIEDLEAMEARAKKSLLATSSESESERPGHVSSSSSVDDNDNLKKSYKKNTNQSDSDNSSIKNSSKVLNSRFDKRNNKYYQSDSKLRVKCRVKLETLPQRILAHHEKILQRHKDYREYREIQSLVSIENLETLKKRNQDSSSSTDGEEGSTTKNRHKKKKSRIEDDEDLLDHLKKVTDGNAVSEGNEEAEGLESDDNDEEKASETPSRGNTQDVMLAGEKLIKASLLASSDSERESPLQEAGEDVSSKKTTSPLSKKSTLQNSDSENETTLEKKHRSNWRRDKLLTARLSSTDSEGENQKIGQRLSQREAKANSDSDVIISDSSPTKQSKKNRLRRRRLASDSDSPIRSSDSDSDAGVFQKKEPIKVDKLITRKRRANSGLSDDSSSSSREVVKLKTRKRIKVQKDSDESSAEEDASPSQSKGRKNIRKVIKDRQVTEDTKAAARDEEERLKRIAERQKVYNAIHEARIASEERVDKLVLDFDETTKEPILSVDEALVKKLKPHQAQGIKFMWDACFESVERAKTTPGSGCILAHCMGLGKSFQVVTLSYTLLVNHELTAVHRILIVAPLSTVLNWKNEFKIWLSEVKNGEDIEVYEMTKAKNIEERRYILENWQNSGGVMIMGYEMYRNLTNVAVNNGKKEKNDKKEKKKEKKENVRAKKVFNEALVDPGPDLVVCDEGHLLKNEESAISKAMKRVTTLRRIVLTGTPLQNNLREYHCMVQFVKPNLLGTKKEFSNRFVNPIQNGQFDDSTEYDVKIMKKRAHVLHKMLEGSVQRFDYSVLTPFLPPKQEYVILVKLTSVQQKMYLHYLENHSRLHKEVGGSLFADFQALQRIWTHPIVVKQQAEARAKLEQKKREEEEATESEGSIKDFIDDDSLSSHSSSSTESDVSSNASGLSTKKNKKPDPPKRSTRANPVEPSKDPEEPEVEVLTEEPWWPQFLSESDYDDMRVSGKLILLFDIIKECEAIGDKILIFSQSLYSLTLIEKFLAMIDEETQNNSLSDSLNQHSGRWILGQDYFRIDGQTTSDNRSIWVKAFNKPSNTQARLFLISTRAGGLGINLTAANRVVIFDASWNPSHDVQSIFRIYRFGQKKPCYVYRLLAAGTMEEKIYNRQVTKLSLSCRVVDEQQIVRHFSNNDLTELYRYDPPKNPAPTLPLPKDRMWADILHRHRDLVETYLEHDSLLENVAEEMLDEEERKQAWLEYEEEKAGKRPIFYNQQQQLQQMQQAMQYAFPNDVLQQFPLANLDLASFPPALVQQAYEQMANANAAAAAAAAAALNMPNLNYTDFNQTMLVPNPLHGSKSAQAALLQLAPQQQQRVSLSNMTAQQQAAYAQKFGNNLPGVTVRPVPPRSNPVPRTVDISEDDVVEIPVPPSSRTVAQVGAGKRQEE